MKKLQNLFLGFVLSILFTQGQLHAGSDRTTQQKLINVHNMSDTPVAFWFWGIQGIKDNSVLSCMVDVNQITQLTIPVEFKILNIGCRRFIDKEGKFPVEWDPQIGWQLDFSIENMYKNDDLPTDIFVHGRAQLDQNSKPTILFNGTFVDAQGQINPALWLECWKLPVDFSQFKSADEALKNDTVKNAVKIFYQDIARIDSKDTGDKNNRVFIVE